MPADPCKKHGDPFRGSSNIILIEGLPCPECTNPPGEDYSLHVNLDDGTKLILKRYTANWWNQLEKGSVGTAYIWCMDSSWLFQEKPSPIEKQNGTEESK